MLALKKEYANKTIEEIAAAAVGLEESAWTSKSFKSTELRNLVLRRLADKWELDTTNDTHFELLMKLTDEAMKEARAAITA